ncbi:proteasome activator complex subunit 1-like [Hemiscyllium ocellatum]|uniref:proteasome activator complex subunit 1-like n=1 Tax=Hemiscyllium ocellatum TaxID=170820 RepID=UPI00296776E8|nr:proteasome activator complex subunit 1-like [Hemiscyllium ocellatum]
MATLPIDGSTQLEVLRQKLCSQVKEIQVTTCQKLQELTELLEHGDLNIPDPKAIRVELDIPIPDPVKDKLKEEAKKKREEAKKDKDKDKDKEKDKGNEDEGPPCGPVPTNEKMVALIARVKQEMRALKEANSVVSLWLQLNIPKIEDGNNFGVAVQEKVFEAMTNSRTKIDGFLTQITK